MYMAVCHKEPPMKLSFLPRCRRILVLLAALLLLACAGCSLFQPKEPENGPDLLQTRQDVSSPLVG